MNAADVVPLGRSALSVSRLGLGGGPIGGLFEPVSDLKAHATVAAALEGGLRLFDVAPLYGHGRAEQRMGQALREVERDRYVLSTKVGRLLRPGVVDPGSPFRDTPPVGPIFDFSYEGARRSLAESLDRLGLDRIDLLFVHDPDFRLDQALVGAFPAVAELRGEGVVVAIGVGTNDTKTALRIVRETDIDCLLLANRLTLLDQSSLDEVLPACVDRNVAVIAGGVFNSGVLAAPARSDATYEYAPAPSMIIDRARALEAICREHEVDVITAALRFPLRHPAVDAVLVGARSPSELTNDIALFNRDVPEACWRALTDRCGLRDAAA
jgi:D-threo-aldose 1-dehydrogenase